MTKPEVHGAVRGLRIGSTPKKPTLQDFSRVFPFINLAESDSITPPPSSTDMTSYSSASIMVEQGKTSKGKKAAIVRGNRDRLETGKK